MADVPVILSTVIFISGAATVLFLFTSASRRGHLLRGARVDVFGGDRAATGTDSPASPDPRVE
ncbi:MAG TPA: hypothetical protein VN241_04610 [Microbacterium sp.]|nr:hypothetical protein [Microbacterium sp.]